jgi:hypothetical protein
MTTDRVSGGVLVLFALLVIWESRHLPLGTFRQPGPAYVPILLALLLLMFAVSLMLTSGGAPLLSSVPWTEWRLDAPEFQKFWDKDAKMLAVAIKRVGRVEIPEAK